MKIIVTNDDSIESPLLEPWFDEISKYSWCSELGFVVPAQEKSWIAGAISRFAELKAEKITKGSTNGYTVNGTPADCVSLGLHNIYPTKADVVLSGINIGNNGGLPFFLSSGTVGGAQEAFLTRVPGIAVSVDPPKNVAKAWVNRQGLDQYKEDWIRIAKVSSRLVDLLIQSSAYNKADIWNVNLPWEADENTAHQITTVHRGQYGKLFGKTGENTYRHDFKHEELLPEENAPQTTDWNTVKEKKISITPISYQLNAVLPEEITKLISSINQTKF